MVRLARDVGIGAQDDGVVTVLGGLGSDAIADDLEERILQSEETDADGAILGFFDTVGGLRRGCIGFVAAERKREQAGDEGECELFFHGVWVC